MSIQQFAQAIKKLLTFTPEQEKRQAEARADVMAWFEMNSEQRATKAPF